MNNHQARILIVDDNPRNIQILAKLLTEQGYQPEYAMNGEEALEWCSLEIFDLILLDVMMPDMDGFSVCRQIKELRKNTETPVIFLTAKTDMDSIKKGFQSGGIDYISKPFAFDELLARVETQVELSISRKKLKQVNHWLEDEVKSRTEELERLNQQLMKANDELHRLDKAKSEFIQLLSHEIRTPLNGVLGSLSLLKSIQMGGESKELVEILDLSVQRLERFSFMALDVSLLRSRGKLALNHEESDLYEVVELALTELSDKIRSQNLKVILHQESGLETILTIDRKFISKALINLLENAISHSPANGTISIDISQKNQVLQVTIHDEGAGFPEKIIHYPFKPFSAYQRHDANFGLGLHLTQLIMESHNGQLQIGNNESKGAYATLIFHPESVIVNA